MNVIHCCKMWKGSYQMNIFVSVFISGLILAEAKEQYDSQNMDPVGASMWGLPVKSTYEIVYKITDKNHEALVLDSEDPWIIICYKTKIDRKWIQHSKKVGGAIWYGKIDLEKNLKLAKALSLDDATKSFVGGVAVAFPAVSDDKIKQMKSNQLMKFTDPGTAEEHVSNNMEDKTIKLDFSPTNMKTFNDWVVSSYYKSTFPKFPLICVSDEPGTPTTVKAVSRYFNSHFAIAVVPKSAAGRMMSNFKEVPEPKTYPMFYILLGREPSSEEMNRGNYNMHFNVFPYITEKYGDSSTFYSLVNYLVLTNQDYRPKLPGRRSDESKSVTNMEETKKKLKNRASKLIKSNSKSKTEL